MSNAGRIAMVVGLLVGCGGSAGTGPVSQADAKDACQTICEQQVSCSPEGKTVEECTADCTSEAAGVLRADFVEAVADCYADLTCTEDEDKCFAVCEPTAAHETFETDCRDMFARCGLEDAENQCETTPNPSAGDNVGDWCIFTPAIIDELDACLSKDCELVPDCMQAALARHGGSL